MSWIARLLYFIFVVVLFRAILSMLFPGRSPQSKRSAAGTGATVPGSGTEVVRDPQCGMYIDPSLAVLEKKQGEVLYFCSEACRDSFLGSVADMGTGRSKTH